MDRSSPQAPLEPWKPSPEELARIREEIRPIVAESARRSAAVQASRPR
jgi:hypothetical protein